MGEDGGVYGTPRQVWFHRHNAASLVPPSLSGRDIRSFLRREERAFQNESSFIEKDRGERRGVMVTVRFEWNAEVGCAAFWTWEWNSCTWRGLNG